MSEDEIKEYLRQEIINYIKSNNLKQHEAAVVFRIQQPNLNKIIKGHLNSFSINRLIRLIKNAGMNIVIKVEDDLREESTV